MLVMGAIVGFLAVFFFNIIESFSINFFKKKNTNIMLGIFFLISSLSSLYFLFIFVSTSLYLYNSINTGTVIFLIVISLIFLANLYATYLKFFLNESYISVTFQIVSILSLYLSFMSIQNLGSEIKPDEYKSLNVIYEKISVNSKTKKIYETVFPQIIKDDVITRAEYRKITKIEDYFVLLQEQENSSKTKDNELLQKQTYFKEAKQKYLQDKF